MIKCGYLQYTCVSVDSDLNWIMRSLLCSSGVMTVDTNIG